MQNQQGVSLIGIALQQMKKSIICGELAPGEKLKMSELSRIYGVSVTPVREALHRLAQEGMVDANEQKGFRVALLSVQGFQQITQLRRLLEREALAEAIRHGDDAWEADVLGSLHRLKVVEKRLGDVVVALDDDWSKRHKAFHLSLFSACPSDMMLRLIDSFFDQAERYRRFLASHPGVHRCKDDEHQKLFDAVLSRDLEGSLELIDIHADRMLQHVTEALQQRDPGRADRTSITGWGGQ